MSRSSQNGKDRRTVPMEQGERADMTGSRSPLAEEKHSRKTESGPHELLPTGHKSGCDPKEKCADQWVCRADRYNVNDVSSVVTKQAAVVIRSNNADAEQGATNEIGEARTKGNRTHTGRRENEHERGKCSAEGTVEGGGRRENEHGRGKLILKDTRDQGEAEISGMGLATHTLICIIT